MHLVVFMPAVDEEKTIGNVIQSIPKVKNVKRQTILVVDDGSRDKTKSIAEKLGAIVVSHSKTSGVGAGFQTGVKNALILGADIMVTIDADGQFPAKKIPQLVEPLLRNEADFVTASRFMRKEDLPINISRIKTWGNKQIARIISLLTGKKFYDVSCGFRAYSKEALLNLNVFGQFTYTQEVFIDLSMKGLTIKEVPIGGVKYFKKRKSRVFKGAFNYAFRSLAIILRTMRDYKPLKFFGLLGLAIFTLGLFADFFLLIYYLNTQRFSPYISVGFIGGFLNILGIILFIVGLVADMLDRIRANQERILYFQKKRLYDSK